MQPMLTVEQLLTVLQYKIPAAPEVTGRTITFSHISPSITSSKRKYAHLQTTRPRQPDRLGNAAGKDGSGKSLLRSGLQPRHRDSPRLALSDLRAISRRNAPLRHRPWLVRREPRGTERAPSRPHSFHHEAWQRGDLGGVHELQQRRAVGNDGLRQRRRERSHLHGRHGHGRRLYAPRLPRALTRLLPDRREARRYARPFPGKPKPLSRQPNKRPQGLRFWSPLRGARMAQG